MESLKKRAEALLVDIKLSIDRIGIHKLEAERDELRKEMQRPDFWQSRQKAQELSKKEADLTRRLAPWKEILTAADRLTYLAGTGDISLSEEISENLEALEKKHIDLKKELRFSGPYDDHDVILGIYAGAGGTDAQDWAQMLLRMYVRWAEKSKFKVQSLDQSPGEEAGIKGATLKISGGEFLYGKLAGEHGVHRLVRLSPFNADNLRQTSFAKVEVLPAVDKPGEVQIDEKELKIDVFRASGRGGQSVNTTDSAVRVTHLPTGISTSIQTERSQLQNKQTALSILRSKIVQLQLEQHTQNIAELKGPSQSAEWGNQIRSYVLHPYKQVKDLRSGYETTDPLSVLDGNLDPLINSWLEKL